MATGVGFSFDTSFLKNLEKADKQMDELMKKSNQASRSIISAFQQMTQRGVVPFVESLEKEKRTLEAVSAALTTRSGKVRKGYEEMAQSVMNTINVLTKLESKVKSTTQYKEGVANRDAERDLATYKQLVVEIQRLNEIKRQALGAQSSGDPTLRADATRTLQEANRQLQDAQKQAQGIKIKYAQETAAIERDISMRGFQTRLNQMVSAEERLNQRRLAWVRDVDAAQARAEQNKLNRINKRFEIEERRERRSAEKEERRLNTPQGALEYARGLKSGVKSIDTMNLALQRLKNAQNGLDRNTKGWKKKYKEIQKEINAIEKELGKVHTTQRGLMDTSGQLARAMAAVFSVSAIKGYINKLIQVRGEFELQQRSLQVLLQNKAEANELWDKTVALAVKSPLTTKQLVTSTKQLAAYRIESDKLYETNKMLADVSQGLGVDMNRLILAFGQVKAASFLRGTELRQFSEAGVNMLDELANHFEKLEGRAVSVAEVFERVSKRMVTFEDVETVFKNITSKGGTFYQMQEKQSKTLKGMMLNLKDSYELMLNDIGEEQEGLLKGFVNLMRELVRSWRELAPLIKTAGLSFLAYFSFSKIAQLVAWFNNLAVAIKSVGAASALATNVNPWVALATVITAVAVAAYELCTAVSEFEAISVSVNKEVTEIFTEQVALYKELADKYHDATTSEEERKEILGELQQKYKEILPDMYTELKYIEAYAGHYQAAEEAMRSYYNSMAIERKKSKIMAYHEESLYQTDIPELAEQWRQEISDMDNLTKLEKEHLNAVIPNIIAEAVEAYISGAESDWEKGISDRATKYIGKEISRKAFYEHGTYQGWFDQLNLFNRQMFDMAIELGSLKRELDSVSGLAFGTLEDEFNSVEIEAIKKRIKEVEEAYKALSGIYKQLSQGKLDVKDVEEKVKAPVKVLVDAFGEEEAKGIEENLKNISNSVYDFTVGLNGVTVGFYNQLAAFAKTRPSLTESLLDKIGLREDYNPLVDVLSQKLKNTAKEYNNIQKEVINVFEEVRDKFNLSSADMDVFAALFPNDSKTLSDVRTNLSGKIEQLTGDIKLYKNAVESGNPNENPLGFKDEDVKKWEKQIKWLQLALDMLGGDLDKDKKGRSRDLVDERLRVIKEIYKAYKELNKTFDETTSKTGAIEKFGDAFYSAFGKTPEEMGYNLFTAEGVVDAYNKFISTLSNVDDITKGNLAKGEFVMELQVERKQAADKQIADEIASMFDGYELSLELDKLNIPKDLASRLFGIEDIDLSDIRKRIEQEIYNAQLKGGQEDFIAKRKEELEKVKDMEIKQQRELLKTYSKYLVQAQSERIKIKLDELRQLKEIESLEIGDADKELMRQGVQKDIQKRLDTQAWKDFQESGMYVRLFDNLEGASMHSLDKMENALMGLRDSLKDLDPSELKEINNQLEKIRDIKVDKNPFKGLADDAKTYFEYVKNRKEWEASLDASEEKEANIRSEADSQSLLIKSLEDELDLIDQTTVAGIQQALALESKIDFEKEYLKVLLDELEAQGKITKKERERIEKGQDAGKSMQDRLNKTAQDISAVISSMADMATNLEAAFGMSDSLKDTFELLQGIGGGVSDMFSGAAGLFSGNPLQMIQGGMQLVGGVSKIFASFNEAHDKRIERKIESEIKLVERLGKLYEKLDKQIEAAYSIDTFQAANDAAKENLEQQIRATERMIEAEKDKKKTDHKRIEEWREQIEENLEMLEELEAKRLQEFGGVGGEDAYKDIAQGFTDAWFDAFLETGDGLDALNDHFDEVLNNMVKKQLALRATNSFLAPIFEEIDKAVKDTKVTNEEMQNIKELASQTMPELAAFLENIATEMGMSEYAGKNGELSGLSAGIQGVSEETADILASYMNSIRFFVADSNTQLKALVAAQGVNADTPNPMLSQLLVIAEQTRSIRDMFESVIGRGGNNKHGGAYLKVDIG